MSRGSKYRQVIHVDFIADTPDSTVSRLSFGDNTAYIIEDGFRPVKVPGATRIQGGEYKLAKRTVGRFYNMYKKRWGHDFSIELLDTPDFSQVLIHTGNYKDHTRGCLLINNGFQYHPSEDVYKGIDSWSVYKYFYNWLFAAFEQGDVWISINRH